VWAHPCWRASSPTFSRRCNNGFGRRCAGDLLQNIPSNRPTSCYKRKGRPPHSHTPQGLSSFSLPRCKSNIGLVWELGRDARVPEKSSEDWCILLSFLCKTQVTIFLSSLNTECPSTTIGTLLLLHMSTNTNNSYKSAQIPPPASHVSCARNHRSKLLIYAPFLSPTSNQSSTRSDLHRARGEVAIGIEIANRH